MLKRKKFIEKYLDEFIPNVISKIISEYDYCFNGDCELTFEAHSDWIFCCSEMTNGKLITGSCDRTLKIWNTLSGNCELILEGHTHGIKCCSSMYDGYNYKIVSGSNDYTAKMWNIKNDELSDLANKSNIVRKVQCDLTLEGHTFYVTCCAFLPDGRIVTGSADKTLKIWNTQTIQKKYAVKCELTLYGHTLYVNCCCVMPDGKIVSGSNDKTLKIWNIKTGNCELTLDTNTSVINCCYCLPDERIVSGSSDGTLKIWNIKTQKCDLILYSYHYVSCLARLPNGRIISGSHKILKIFNEKTGECESTLEAHSSWIYDCCILSDGRLVTVSENPTVKIWS